MTGNSAGIRESAVSGDARRVDLHAFATPAELAQALAARVATKLAEAIDARGRAVLAVSGGTTPKAFFAALSAQLIAWEKVTVTLVDERFVPADHVRSNAGLVRAHLMIGAAARARFLPLYHPAADAEAAAAEADRQVAALGQGPDVAILGMGGDGHTASFFPRATRLAEAIDRESPHRVIALEAPDAGEPRLTMTLKPLLDAGDLMLHIEGAAKRAVLDTACGPGAAADMPIRAVIDAVRKPLDVYWAP